MALDNGYTIPNPGEDKSMEVVMAAKMQAILQAPMVDVSTYLVNRDFEGDFLKQGDTVSIVKPDPKSVKFQFGRLKDGKVLAGNVGTKGQTDGAAKDARLKCTVAEFQKNTLTIDSYAKYAFAISDVTEAEGKWNYESGNLDLEANNLRRGHNMLTLQHVIDSTDTVQEGDFGKIGTVAGSTAANPIVITNGDDLYKKVILPMRSRLYARGAITNDGHITYGSNAQQKVNTKGAVIMPQAAYDTLLTSQYFTLGRGTSLADERVAGKEIERIANLDIVVELSLDPKDEELDANEKVVLKTPAEGHVVAIIAGTPNCITRAGKVLPPQSFVSHTNFATEYHGMEIYGEKIVEPKAGIVAYVKLPA